MYHESTLAELHLQDLHREADQARRVKQARGDQPAAKFFQSLRNSFANRSPQPQPRPAQIDFDSGVFTAR